jgi:hypothetical protein
MYEAKREIASGFPKKSEEHVDNEGFKEDEDGRK